MKAAVSALAATLLAALAVGSASAADAARSQGPRPSRRSPRTPTPPLNFADPKTGQGIGWEYDAVNEIGKRLNAKIDWNTIELGRDDPGRA